MLRVVYHKSAAAALKYYSEGLRREDYYSEGQEIAGKWYGRAAERLGIEGHVARETFAALVENRHPVTGKKLTPRTNAERIVGCDINFHAPKSLSVLYGLTQDKAILNAFRESVAAAMNDLEHRTATRVRRKGADENRQTQNLAWAEFVHFTARPVGGIPDPHLHIHCFAFNATFDAVESRWKAANFRSIKEEAPYSEALFHSVLTEKLTALGYDIVRRGKGWEIKDIPSGVIDKFSRRTAQVEQLAQELGISDAKEKDKLGAASREHKNSGMTMDALREAWKARMSPEELAAIAGVYRAKQTVVQPSPEGHPKSLAAAAAADKALAQACATLFAKDSVVEVNRLLAEGLRFGVGKTNLKQLQNAFMRREMLVKEIEGKMLCTTVEVLAEEVSLIQTVRDGRGRFTRLLPRDATKAACDASMLSKEQLVAMRHILSSPDQVIAVRGVAGAGKTTLMQDVVPAIESGGKKVFAFAPSASASRGTQREAGFENADTIARLLVDTQLQRQVKGQVIWIDEVGLVGVRDMSRIMKIAGPETVIIITGDAEQHAPVARGDNFRLLQQFSGLKVAEVRQVRRQEREEYRAAVTALSQGDLSTAFARLEGLGAIWEMEDAGQRYALLAGDYVEISHRGSVPLVVSPTHAEGARVTTAIRDALKADGRLGSDQPYLQYRNLQWEPSERGHADFYEPGMMVQFHQNAPGIKRGSLFTVTERTQDGRVMMEGNGLAIPLPLKYADRFQVFESRKIALSQGDMVRLTRNGESVNGKRLNNGDTFSIKDIGKNGELILSNGAVLDKNHGHLDYGYCSTSHSSQSKTVRDVLVAQSVDSFLASSREQFYVSVSRGRDTVRIYTDNRRELQEAVGNTSTRLSGMEFAGITGQDLTPLMASEALNGDQWRKHVRSLHSEDKAKSFVDTLLKQRHQSALAKPEAFSWEVYIQMRRANVTTDGKARARVGPEPKKLSGDKVFQQRPSMIRPTSPQHAVEKKPDPAQPGKEAPKQAKEKEKAAEPSRSKGKLGRIEAALASSANHLKSVLSRSQSGAQAKSPLPPSPGSPGTQEPAKPKREREREPMLPLRSIKAAAQQVLKKEGKQAEKKPQKVATIPPPAPKRGR